jgi:hypothetical protein
VAVFMNIEQLAYQLTKSAFAHNHGFAPPLGICCPEQRPTPSGLGIAALQAPASEVRRF